MERRTGCERPNDGVRAREKRIHPRVHGRRRRRRDPLGYNRRDVPRRDVRRRERREREPKPGRRCLARRVLFPGRSTARDVRLPRVGARVGRGESREGFLVARAQRRRRRRLRVQSGWRVGRHSLRRRNRAAVGSERRTRARVPRRRKRVQLLGGGVRAHRRASRRRHRNPAGGALTLQRVQRGGVVGGEIRRVTRDASDS